MSMIARIAALALLALLCGGSRALARVERYAVIIGNNRGSAVPRRCSASLSAWPE